MARPRGYRLNRAALLDLLEAKRLSMTEGAAACGMPLKTLSALAQGGHRASMTRVRELADGLGCRHETLFPELGSFVERSDADAEAAA